MTINYRGCIDDDRHESGIMKGSEYFSHDYNASDDPKIVKLIMEKGMEAYGIYWRVVEQLYKCNGEMPMDCQSIAFALHSHCDRIKEVLEGYDLFYFPDPNIVRSRSVDRRLEERAEKSEVARRSAKLRWENKGSMRTHSDINATAMLVKERKGKEKKVKTDNNNRARPSASLLVSLDEVKAYCQERKNNVSPEEWYDFYASKGWMVGKNTMRDWRASVRLWERRKKENGGLNAPANSSRMGRIVGAAAPVPGKYDGIENREHGKDTGIDKT